LQSPLSSIAGFSQLLQEHYADHLDAREIKYITGIMDGGPATTATGATWVADKLLMALEQPFVRQGHRFVIEASVGIAVYPQHGGDVTTLLRRADSAMPAPAAERAADPGCCPLLRWVMR
jgi:GGDEF domain-containing protein